MLDNQIPNLGKLSIALLESKLEALVGKEPIKVLKEPLEKKELRLKLARILSVSETRLRKEFPNAELARALLDLPLANLPSFQIAVQDFYEHPSNSLLFNTIKSQLQTDYPNFNVEIIESAANSYLTIIREELLPISEEIRQKITSLAILGIESSLNKTLETLTKGDELFKKLDNSKEFSRNIKTRTFKTLVDERTHNFIGRDYVFKAIDEIIMSKTFSSGYIMIHGEPGIGKTSLIAQLIKVRGYLHHFNIASQNICSTKDFLSNICSQLIINFELGFSKLPENLLSDSGFLVELLSNVAEKRPHQNTILLIDAIDEASDIGLSPSSNRLCLPVVLPQNTYFIVTTREHANYRLLVDNRHDIYLRDSDPQNLEDVRCYIENFVEEYRDTMNNHIAKWGLSKTNFVELVTEKSQGNFMYLVHVLRDIRDNRIIASNLDNIHNLPVGLRQYYQMHWQALQEKNKEYFDRFEKPIICILATIREPVSIKQLMEWTSQPELEIKHTINKWREFLNVEADDQGEFVHRIYHASFQDFLREEVGLKPYHELIVRSALSKIRHK